MKLGTERLSSTQREMLERARSLASPRELGEMFYRIINDSDIRKEEEYLHPDWVRLFEEKREQIQRYIPGEAFDRLNKDFDALKVYDRELTGIDPDKLAITFLLGAGASKPAPSNIPTVKELLPHLLERARRLDREDVTKLADFCEGLKIDNIEDLLTAAQLATFCSKTPLVLRLLNYLLYRRDTEVPDELIPGDLWSSVQRRSRRITESSADMSSVAFLQDTLQVLFGLLASTMLPSQPNKAHESIATYAHTHPGATIVTTNYDCCMDLALESVSQDFTYCIDFCNRKPVTMDGEAHFCQLIKMHGSLNWYYCETCQEVQIVDMTDTIKRYMEDSSPYPVIGICRVCGGQKRGLLVPPLAMKFDIAPPLTPLLPAAEAAFEKADLIVVVGFSFAEADVYISRMLSKTMQSSSNQRLVIVDPDSRVVSRVRRKFKASIPNFDVHRIVKINGDCDILLPQFLSGQLHKDTSVSKTSIAMERKQE